jgi:hypothetical protein
MPVRQDHPTSGAAFTHALAVPQGGISREPPAQEDSLCARTGTRARQ